MADFEGLIRQALARQNADDPVIRQKIYQSSRNALARMIASAGAQPPDLINEHREALENSIRRIEAAYAGPPHAAPPAAEPPAVEPPPPVAEPPAFPAPPASASQHSGIPPDLPPSPLSSPQDAPEPAASVFAPGPPQPVPPQPEPSQPYPPLPGAPQSTPVDPLPPHADVPTPQVGDVADQHVEPSRMDAGDAPSVAPEDMPAFPRRRRRPGRLIAIIAFIGLLGLVGWLLYTLADTLTLDEPPASTAGSQPVVPGAANQQADPEGADYITVLSPVSTGTLVTAGRGRAEIINQSNMDYIRLVSLRSESARETTAEPILLRLEPGVLGQISGSRVTVEILAKSGGTGPANFAVGCRIGEADVCGRKRFRIGLQPEATVFTMSVPSNVGQNGEAYLTINTDVSATAAQSGEGAAVDVLYARLRLSDQ